MRYYQLTLEDGKGKEYLGLQTLEETYEVINEILGEQLNEDCCDVIIAGKKKTITVPKIRTFVIEFAGEIKEKEVEE